MARQRWRAPAEVLWLQALATQTAWRAEVHAALVAGVAARQDLGTFDADLDAAAVSLRAAIDDADAARMACERLAARTPVVAGGAYRWLQSLSGRLATLKRAEAHGADALVERLALRTVRKPRVRALLDKLRTVLPEVRGSALARHRTLAADFLADGDAHVAALDAHEGEVETADAARALAADREEAARTALVGLLRSFEAALDQDRLDHGTSVARFAFEVIEAWRREGAA